MPKKCKEIKKSEWMRKETKKCHWVRKSSVHVSVFISVVRINLFRDAITW